MRAFASIEKFLILRILLLHFSNFVILAHGVEISGHGLVVSIDTFSSIICVVCFQVTQKSILDMLSLVVKILLSLKLVNSLRNRWRDKFDALGSLPKKSNGFIVISFHRLNLWCSPGLRLMLRSIRSFSTTSEACNWA